MMLPRFFYVTQDAHEDDIYSDDAAVYLSPIGDMVRLRAEVKDGLAVEVGVFYEAWYGDRSVGSVQHVPVYVNPLNVNPLR